MKLLLDNLFFFGQTVSLIALAWGAGLVLRESLAGVVCPDIQRSGSVASLMVCLVSPIRRLVRA